VWLLALATLACLILALGDKGLVYAALRRVLPGLGFMRFPIKVVILPTFLVPLLAAYSVAQWRSLNGEARRRTQRDLICATVVFLLVIGFIAFAAFQYPMQGIATETELRSALTSLLALVLFVITLIATRRFTAGRFAALPCFALVGLVWLDAMTSEPRPNPTVARWVYEPGLAARESGMNPVPRTGNARAMLNSEAEGNINVVQLTNAADTVVYSRLGFFGNANLLDDVPKVIGSYSLYFRELNDVFRVLYGNAEPPSGFMDFLAVSQVNAPGKITQWNFRPTHLPWVTGGQKPVFADAETTVHALGRREFDPRREVYLPPELRNLVTVSNSSSSQVQTSETATHWMPSPHLYVGQFSSRLVRIGVEASEPALIVVAQSFSRNWRAYTDGKPTPLLRANHAFQAVEIVAGHHEIILKYEDGMFQWGVVISAVTAAACALLWLRGKRKAQA